MRRARGRTPRRPGWPPGSRSLRSSSTRRAPSAPAATSALRAALELAWVCARADATAALIPARSGRLLFVAPRPDAGPHAEAARAGLESLARTLSVEWARHTVTPLSSAPAGRPPTPSSPSSSLPALGRPAATSPAAGSISVRRRGASYPLLTPTLIELLRAGAAPCAHDTDPRSPVSGPQRAARVRMIRQRVIAGAVALFVATWMLITLMLVTGHDPALARQTARPSPSRPDHDHDHDDTTPTTNTNTHDQARTPRAPPAPAQAHRAPAAPARVTSSQS